MNSLSIKNIIVIFCVFITKTAICQDLITNLNDSTFVYEDTATVVKIPLEVEYPIKVTFYGTFFKDSIKLYYNNRIIFSDTLSTMDEQALERHPYSSQDLTINVNQQNKDSVIFTINRTEINVPIKFGYALLYISTAAARINNKNKITYNFLYTNQELRHY